MTETANLLSVLAEFGCSLLVLGLILNHVGSPSFGQSLLILSSKLVNVRQAQLVLGWLVLQLATQANSAWPFLHG